MLESNSGNASKSCAAALGCSLALLLCTCARLPAFPLGLGAGATSRPATHRSAAPDAAPGTCAWFGAASRKVLYFGESSFWANLRAAGGKPEALRPNGAAPGPAERQGGPGHGRSAQRGEPPRSPLRIGRFDLRKQRFLPPLPVGGSQAGDGTWDVLVHPNGRVYFTTFFGAAGAVDPKTGRVWHFPGLGRGLNELALGPDDTILATRYGDGHGGRGSGAVVEFSTGGALLGELPLEAPAGWQAAAKSLAFDPIRGEIWVNTDLLPLGGGPARHDVRVLSRGGRELLRIASPEVEFMSFGRDGTGYFAEREGSLLRLRIRPPERAGDIFLTGRLVPLDDHFPPGDFVQDIQPLDSGGAVVTRWSGRIHLVDAKGDVRSLRLPRQPEGLYYTGVLHGDRLCATLCQGITVVCTAVSR